MAAGCSVAAARRSRPQLGVLLLLLLLVDGAPSQHLNRAGQQEDPWQVLGVRRSATKQEITRAYRRLSRELHPDKNRDDPAAATARFQQISAAYDALTKASTSTAQAGSSPLHAWTADRLAAAFSSPEAMLMTAWEGVQIVTDLDPLRLAALTSAWLEEQAARHADTFLPVWTGSIDRAACWALAESWRLPQLAEPLASALARARGGKHAPGSWRAWRVSGAALELSAWAARQPACLAYASMAAGGSAGDAAGEALAQLQQQMDVRRRVRQAAVVEQRRREQRRAGRKGSASSSSSSSSADTQQGDAAWPSVQPDAAVAGVDATQTALAWLVLLAATSWLLLLRHDRLLVATGAAVAGGTLYAIGAGLLLPTEAALQDLAALLGSSATLQAGAVKLWMLVAWLSACLLAPVLLLGGAAVVLTVCWAVVSVLGLALTPTLSQCGLAVWLFLTAWNGLAAGNIPRVAGWAGAGVLLWKRPAFGLWLLSMLLAPPLLLLHVVKELLRASGLFWWRSRRSRGGSRVQAGPEQQQQQQQEDEPANHAAAAAAQAVAEAAAVPLEGGAADVCATAAVRPAAPSKAASGTGGSGSSSAAPPPAGAARQPAGSGRLLPDGPWIPASLSPPDLAATAVFYIAMAAQLAAWCCGVALTSAKLTACLALLGVAGAACGAPVRWLTLQRLVVGVLLRGGPALGLVLKLKLWQPLLAAQQ